MANPEFKENCGNGENITIEAGNICNWPAYQVSTLMHQSNIMILNSCKFMNKVDYCFMYELPIGIVILYQPEIFTAVDTCKVKGLFGDHFKKTPQV